MTSWATSVFWGTLTVVLHVVYVVQTYCVYGLHKLVWGCRGTVYVVQGTVVWGLELLGTSVSWGCGSLKSSNKQPSSHGSYRERVLSRYYSPWNQFMKYSSSSQNCISNFQGKVTWNHVGIIRSSGSDRVLRTDSSHTEAIWLSWETSSSRLGRKDGGTHTSQARAPGFPVPNGTRRFTLNKLVVVSQRPWW